MSLYQLHQLGFIRRLGYGSGLSTPPALSDQFISPYMAYNTSTPEFTVEPYPLSFEDPFINDLWDHWHRMIIDLTTSDGYVLTTGLPVPESEKTGAGDYSLSGINAGLFTVHPKTHPTAPGGITLSNASGVAAAIASNTKDNAKPYATHPVVSMAEGVLYFTYNTPNGGAYDITVPVYDPADRGETGGSGFYAAFRFYDSAGTETNFANGGAVEAALNVFQGGYYPSDGANKRPRNMFFKRGSSWPNALDVMYTWPSSRRVFDYGDPAEASPLFTVPVGYTGTAALTTGGTGHNAAGSIVEGVEIDCNNVCFRGFETAGDNLILRRVKIKNNKTNVNANGFYIRNHTNFIGRWLETENINGDGFYVIDSKKIDMGFGLWRPVSQAGGDSGQSVNEGNVDEFNSDLWLHDSIGLVKRGTGKGAFANEGNVRLMFERMACQSDYFGGTGGDFFITSRHNIYEGYSVNDQPFATGHGPSQSSGPTKQYGCIGMNAQVGLYYSGYNAAAEGWQGDEYNRSDLQLVGNLLYNVGNTIKATEPWSGLWRYNIGCDTTYVGNVDQKGVATLENNVSSISVTGDVMTINMTKKCHLYPGCSVTIVDTVNPANNCTTVVTSFGTSYSQVKCTHPATGTAVPSTSVVPGDITITGNPRFTGKTISDNYNGTPDLASLPKFPSIPQLSVSGGNPLRPFETVVCTASVPAGHSAKYIFMISGEIVQETSMNEHTLLVDSYGTDTHKPNVSSLASLDPVRAEIYNSVHKQDVQCLVLLTETATGYQNIYNAEWSDTGLPSKTVAPFDISQISNVLLYLNPDPADITESGGAISDWADGSANGVDFSQATPGNQLTFVSGTPNYVLSESTDYMVSNGAGAQSGLPFAFSRTIYLNSATTHILYQSADWNDEEGFYKGWYVYINAAGEIGIGFGDGGTPAGDNRRSAVAAGAGLTTGQYYHISIRATSTTNVQIYVNGVAQTVSYSGTGGSLTHGGFSYSKLGSASGISPDARLGPLTLIGGSVPNSALNNLGVVSAEEYGHSWSEIS